MKHGGSWAVYIKTVELLVENGANVNDSVVLDRGMFFPEITFGN